jgi:FKBP-type peptidyl-prolyl cis-trans isomerase FklB
MKPISPSPIFDTSSSGWPFRAALNACRTCAALSVCVGLFTVSASGQEASATAPARSTADATGISTTNTPAFKNEKDKLSYALGVNAASQLRKRSAEVDPELYFQGFKAQLSGGKALLTPAEASATVGRFQTELANKEKTEKQRTSKQRGEKNKQEGEAFLAENQTRDGVVTLLSGLQYKILKAGDGKKPTADDTVVCNYLGTLIDGTEFDSTAKHGKPATLPIKKLMKGWREALQLMPVGSKWQLAIPPHLAYGPRTVGHIVGPNATLLFELELLEIKEKPAQEEQQVATAVPADQAGKTSE